MRVLVEVAVFTVRDRRLDVLLVLNSLLLLEGIVVTSINNKLLLVKVNYFLANTIQEVLIVRYNEQSLFPLLQLIIKPNNGILIQVVSRLI
jgi:hypothetical protein